MLEVNLWTRDEDKVESPKIRLSLFSSDDSTGSHN